MLKTVFAKTQNETVRYKKAFSTSYIPRKALPSMNTINNMVHSCGRTAALEYFMQRIVVPTRSMKGLGVGGDLSVRNLLLSPCIYLLCSEYHPEDKIKGCKPIHT